MTPLSFLRGGPRVLRRLESPDGGDPTEIRVTGDGHLITRCGGELIAGPVHPAGVVQRAHEVASGLPCTVDHANQMALLILAIDAQAREG